MDHYISLYIDNELSLNEKILFVQRIHGNESFKDDAVSLLEQEKNNSGSALKHHAPETSLQISTASRPLHYLGLAAAACLLLTLSFLAGANFLLKAFASTPGCHDNGSTCSTPLCPVPAGICTG